MFIVARCGVVSKLMPWILTMPQHRSPVVQQRRTLLPPVVPPSAMSSIPTVRRETYSVLETATALGVSESTVKRLIRNGNLHSVKALGRRLIPVHALTKFLAG